MSQPENDIESLLPWIEDLLGLYEVGPTIVGGTISQRCMNLKLRHPELVGVNSPDVHAACAHIRRVLANPFDKDAVNELTAAAALLRQSNDQKFTETVRHKLHMDQKIETG